MNDTTNEVMAILAEECAEVIQAVSKINRFGIDNLKPGKPHSNREHLAEELGDLSAMIKLCHDFGIVSWEDVKRAEDAKLEKLRQWSNIFNQSSVVEAE